MTNFLFWMIGILITTFSCKVSLHARFIYVNQRKPVTTLTNLGETRETCSFSSWSERSLPSKPATELLSSFQCLGVQFKTNKQISQSGLHMTADASSEVLSQPSSTVWHGDFWNTALAKISSDFGHHYFGQPRARESTLFCHNFQVKSWDDETSCLNTTINLSIILYILQSSWKTIITPSKR